MRRIVRGLLWVVKGVLLAIALAVLVLWPMSRGREFQVSGGQYFFKTESIEYLEREAVCVDGWIILRRDWGQATGGNWLSVLRSMAQQNGEHWRSISQSQIKGSPLREYSIAYGPFHKGSEDLLWSNGDGHWRGVATPCWLIALVAMAWPLASIGLLIRRRVRRRHRERLGCCLQCGYDLRCTPEKGDGLLERCPECGVGSGQWSSKP